MPEREKNRTKWNVMRMSAQTMEVFGFTNLKWIASPPVHSLNRGKLCKTWHEAMQHVAQAS